MQDRYFSDEELVAYLDGEQDFAPADAIDRALPGDAALRARLDALTLDRTALQEAFADVAPDQVMVPLAQDRRPHGGVYAGLCAAAVVAALAVGFVIGSARNAPLNGWADYVAAYQALYSNSTLSHIQAAPAEQQAELDRVAASIGKTMSVDELSMFPGVQYTRSQILSFEGRALIQLAFLTSTGEPLALCIIRSDAAGSSTAAEIGTMEGLSTALWSQDGYDYLLIGGQDEALISRMSSTFQGMSI